MDWAKDDRLGAIVRAGEAHALSHLFRCGRCDERVFLRRGRQRRAHFAHYKESRECEYYTPSLSVLGSPTPPGVRSPTKGLVSSVPSCSRPALFLAKHGERWGLVVRTPQLVGASDGGLLQISHALGVKKIWAHQLARVHQIPVEFASPLAFVEGTGSAESAAVDLAETLARFRSEGNCFRLSDSTGRLLGVGEPLEMEQSYAVVTSVRLSESMHGAGIGLSELEHDGHWFIYFFSLSGSASAPYIASIAAYLQRTVISARPTLHLVDPFPHHYDADGTAVFPTGTTSLFFRLHGEAVISIQQAREVIDVGATELADGLISIVATGGTGEFGLSVGGREEFLGRFDECELFRPRGVSVEVGAHQGDLASAEGARLLQESVDAVSVVCPSDRIADFVAMESSWVRGGKSNRLSPSVLESLSIRAGNFGSAERRTQRQRDVVKSVSDEHRAARTWAIGVAAATGAVESRFWTSYGSPSALAKSLSRGLSWLHPHVNHDRNPTGRQRQ